jgi:hypothetical protein
VDGLVGADFFRERVVQIDFEAQKVRVLNPAEVGEKQDALPLEMPACRMRVKVRVNGSEPQWMRLDTGCATPLQWVTSTVQPGEGGRKVAIGLARLKIPQRRTTVQLGEHTLRELPTGLHRTAIFPGEAGLIGNGLLSRFSVVTIDTRSGRLLLGDLRPSK